MTTKTSSSPETCAHCLGPQNGLSFMGEMALCHPDEGLSCFMLVTVSHHPMPCDGCATARSMLVVPRRDLTHPDTVAP